MRGESCLGGIGTAITLREKVCTLGHSGNGCAESIAVMITMQGAIVPEDINKPFAITYPKNGATLTRNEAITGTARPGGSVTLRTAGKRPSSAFPPAEHGRTT